MDMLKLSHVAKQFGDRIVLNDVTFRVAEHTIFGFVGKNGAGKTTTMKLVLGLLPGDGGEIEVNGMPVHYGDTRTNRFIGYLPDVPEFYSYMTPAEYLRFCGKITGMKEEEIRDRSCRLLELVGLGGEKHRIRGFSRGMKQRLGIAQALLNSPKLLICDEPTSALDPEGRKELLDILHAAKEHTTILFSTHILSDVEHICDEMAFLHEGRIVRSGTIEEMRRLHCAGQIEIKVEHAAEEMCLRTAFPFLKAAGNGTLLLEDRALLPDVLRMLADRRIVPVHMEQREATLEDLFMEVIGK